MMKLLNSSIYNSNQNQIKPNKSFQFVGQEPRAPYSIRCVRFRTWHNTERRDFQCHTRQSRSRSIAVLSSLQERTLPRCLCTIPKTQTLRPPISGRIQRRCRRHIKTLTACIGCTTNTQGYPTCLTYCAMRSRCISTSGAEARTTLILQQGQNLLAKRRLREPERTKAKFEGCVRTRS